MNKKHLSFVLSLVMLFTAVFSLPAVSGAAATTELDGWTLSTGFSVTNIQVDDGNYALQHTGAKSTATAKDKLTLTAGVTYDVTAFVRNETASDSAEITVGSTVLQSSSYGKWEELTTRVVGTGSAVSISVTATGNTVIDSIAVYPWGEGENMVPNPSFESGTWGGFTRVNSYQGRTNVLKGSGSNVIVGSQSVSVQANTYYMLSADFYLEDTPPWLYVDLNDIAGEVQIRGTQVGTWNTISAVWYSGTNTAVSVRVVNETNYDNPNTPTTPVGAAYVDNISLKKVDLGDALITDEGFESGGWTGGTVQSGSYYLYGSKSLKLQGGATAVANQGSAITVDPHTDYFISAWRLRPGSADSDAWISVQNESGTELAKVTGTRYNQTMWNPAQGTNDAEKKTGHWEQIYGFWNSGENTSVKIAAKQTGTEAIYFDDVTFNQFETRVKLDNIFEYGDMEGVYMDGVTTNPTTFEISRAKSEYESFLADHLKNFPTSVKIGNQTYTGFGDSDFTFVSQETTDKLVSDEPVGEITTTKFKHTAGLTVTVESVLYEKYAAYDWIIWIENTSKKNSPIITNWNAADITYTGENPRLRGSYGDAEAYKPYVENFAGTSITKQVTQGRSTDGDSSYFNMNYGNQGVLFAIGWGGEWTLTLDNTKGDDTRMTAGQRVLNTYLEPGEKIRTPLMAFVNYDGRDLDRSTNLWRHWMIDCNMNRVTEDASGAGEDVLPASEIFAATSIQWNEMVAATEENQIDAINYYLQNDIQLSCWWMDAGWYYVVDSDGNYESLENVQFSWANRGTWAVDEKRFPTRFKAISDHANENGIKTLLWFEPETADQGNARTDGTTVHPDWIKNGNFVDFGNEAALEWITNRIIKTMKDGGISIYREDMNNAGLQQVWENMDKTQDSTGIRRGISENKHLVGHYKLWDTILEEFPNATIDSCASGGRRNDLEAMRRGVPLHKTDHAYGDRSWQQGVFTEMARWIPYFGTKANGETAADNNTQTANRYSLRTAIAGAMVLGYDTAQNVPIDWDIVRDISDEQMALGELIYGDYYTLEDWSRDEAAWAGWEFYDTDMGKGYAIAFRRTASTVASKTYKLKGLQASAQYKVWFEDANQVQYLTGKQLMQNGVEFVLPATETSDILHFEKVEVAAADRALTPYITQVSTSGQHKGAITTDGSYKRFDVRFNMALRNNPVSSGYVETGVQNDYKNTMLINGTSVANLLASDSSAVKMDYDARNHILRVYVKSSTLGSGNVTVTFTGDFATTEGTKVTGATTVTYSGGAWGDAMVAATGASYDAKTALQALKVSVGTLEVTQDEIQALDVNVDQAVNAQDALVMLKKSVEAE